VPHANPAEATSTPFEENSMRSRCSRSLVPALIVLVALARAVSVASADDLAEFIGRSDQNGSTITHYGYVTHAAGFADAALFFDPVNRNETTARLTYFATTTLNSRHVLGNVITTASEPGTLTFFARSSPGATFGTPSSFAQGTPVVALALRYYNVLTVQGANTFGQQVGSAVATARAEGLGLQLRFAASGQGTLLVNDPANFASVFLVGGSIGTIP
jgi:hypothetical protein